MQTLDEEIRKYAEHDQKEHIEYKMNLKENSDDAKNDQSDHESIKKIAENSNIEENSDDNSEISIMDATRH